MEAETIALRLRAAVDQGLTAALITPDRMLTRQVAAALDRWDITPDDSGGLPLALSPPGRLLRQTADLMGATCTADRLLALLKHPLTHTGTDRGDHLRHTRDLELHVRRKGLPFPTGTDIRAWSADGREAWCIWLADMLDRMATVTDSPLETLTTTHITLTERLAAGPADGSGTLWDDANGRAARGLCDQLLTHADAGGTLTPRDYAALFSTLIAQEQARAPEGHPQILILGTLEARVQTHDLVILAGLNEGTWPALPPPDPWLNRAMRQQAGLLLPERQIGLSAHDYQQAIAAPQVWLTRSIRSADAQTVPSRWLLRLTNLLEGLPDQNGPQALTAMRQRGGEWLAQATALSATPDAPRAIRPSPRPPVDARPKRLSVTAIPRLIRDPYAIYAEHVLKLRALDPLTPEPDALLRGELIHLILQRFIAGPNTVPALMAATETVLAEHCPWPTTRTLWRARIARIAPWFVATESERQTLGTPAVIEQLGKYPIPGFDFTLSARADRIDLTPDGRALIYDYKSGNPPTDKQQRAFEKQLLLEAALVERGAFRPRPPPRGGCRLYRPERQDRPRPAGRPAPRPGVGRIPDPPAPLGRPVTRLHRPQFRRAQRGTTGLRPPRPVRRMGPRHQTHGGGRPMTRHPATERQVQAADPRASTWVSANAGSGKTRVLTDRVARLLLSGVSPAHILCLTYTKAAAAEMQNRLFRRLGDWAMKPDDTLLAELADLGTDIALSDLPRARRLFAQAMEVPGGLRIQTIHAFCAGLLRRFPLECGVSPQFKEMDDRAAALLRAEVMDSLATAPETEALARIFTGSTLDDLLQDIAGRRDAFAAPFDEPAVRRTLDLPPAFTEQDLIDSILDPATRADLARFVTLCAGGSSTDQKNADRLSRLGHTLADIETLESCFLFGETAANPFGAKIGTVPTKATRARDPDLCARIDDLMAIVQDARPTRLALAALDRTRTLHAFARPYLAALDTAKTRRGLVDFDDLIWRARALLTDPAVAQWVLFKLDGGIDHILVDEAQDTSPLQWQVIRALAQEFAAGEGAHPDRERTIFVVGDLKQSIYSFQGAEPEAFGQMQAHFAAELARIARGLTPLSLDYSFRSAQAVLRVVDLTFLTYPDGLGDRTPTHIAFHETLPGRVDLWDPIPPVTEDKDDRPWHEPMDITGQRHHTAILADRIATECARMIDQETRPSPRTATSPAAPSARATS